MDIQKNTLIHLSLIQNVGPGTIERLISALKFNSRALSDLYLMNKLDICKLAGLSENKSSEIVKGLSDKKLLDKELLLIEKSKIKLLTIFDKEYPELLKNIYLPPALLYVSGVLNNSNRTIAIVGSRKADNYGYSVVNLLVPELVNANWSIVSGGALGIDTMAHKITLDNKGVTVAVLGAGLLCPYPATNKSLFEKIANSGGAVISPFSLQMTALPGNFPARNRIIAGLSRCSVVVQAAQKSGALITAQFALEQGREVCAVPGAINNPLSAGCHQLISQGATLVNSAYDIRLALNDIEEPKKSDIKIVQEPKTAEEKIKFYCTTPISIDELALKTNIEIGDLQDMLFNLQLENIIAQDYAGFWYLA